MRIRFLTIFIISFAAAASCCRGQGGPCHPSVSGRLRIIPLRSRIFHNERKLRVWIPPGYDDLYNISKKYKVLYLLDGQDVFDVCTAEDHHEMHADETLTQLISAGKIDPIIAVGVDAGSPIDSRGKPTDGGVQRAVEYLPFPDPDVPAVRAVKGQKFGAFMQHEVMPLVAANFRILTGPSNTAIWGASYGAVAALYALINRPDLFGAGDVESPAIQVGNGQMMRDTEFLVQGPSRIVFGVGTEEVSDFPGAEVINSAIVQEVRVLADHLRAVAISPPQVRLTVSEGAKHTQEDFGDRFGSALVFLYAPDSASKRR
jgi:predicted alpha/beta superfamily hydrolase